LTLKTDHKNLTNRKDSRSSRVNSWRLDIQQYDLHIEHVPTTQHISADAWSKEVDDGEEHAHNIATSVNNKKHKPI
jgi:hypothetical protein